MSEADVVAADSGEAKSEAVAGDTNATAEEPVQEEAVQEQPEAVPEEPKVEEPAPVEEPQVEEEEEVAASELYKNSAHVPPPEGEPFDPNEDGVSPKLGSGSKLMDSFLASSTLWVAYNAVNANEGKLEFACMGDSVKEMKASLDPAFNRFYLCKARAQDVKKSVVSDRKKCIRFSQLGTTVPVMKRRFKNPAWNLFQEASDGTSFTREIEATDECDWVSWAKHLKKMGGAHQPTQYMFGVDEVWHCE